jgi:membrane protease YdiL (CAAX protease family)
MTTRLLFGTRVPAWPALAGAAALLGGIVVATFAPLIAVIPAALARADRANGVIALLTALLVSGGILLVVVRVAALTRPVTADQLGLRAPDAPGRSLLLLGAAALVLVALAAAWNALGDLGSGLEVPPELDPRTTTAQLYHLPVREPIPFGPELVLSALARCVLPVVAAEVLLRGFAFPALCSWKGPVPAALIVSVLFGGLSQLFGAPGIAVLSMVLGGLLCFLYLATGSLLPGIALSAAAAGVALGAACAMAPATVAVLAVACTAGATLLAAVPLLPRRATVAAPATA